MNKTRRSVPYRIILPDGTSTDQPGDVFALFASLNLIRVSKKNKKIGRVREGLKATVDGETGHLHFEVKKSLIERYAIPSQWRFIIRLFFFKVDYVEGEPQYTELWQRHDQVYAQA